MNCLTTEFAMTEINWGSCSCTDVFNWSEQSACSVLGQVSAQVKETIVKNWDSTLFLSWVIKSEINLWI